MHLAFSVFMTQILAQTCPSILNPSPVRMTARVYLCNIVPIGILYSFSLICSNLVYLYLSVAYIQMLKSAAPVVILVVSWSFGTQKPCHKKFLNVMVISGGVALTTIGERQFSLLGFLCQVGGIMFEALRIVMIEVLINGRKGSSGSDSGAGAGKGGSGLRKMDPLLTLYYYAPVCMVTNFAVALVTESSTFTLAELNRIGSFMLITSAIVAFMLNVCSVFLVGLFYFIFFFSQFPFDAPHFLTQASDKDGMLTHSKTSLLPKRLGALRASSSPFQAYSKTSSLSLQASSSGVPP